MGRKALGMFVAFALFALALYIALPRSCSESPATPKPPSTTVGGSSAAPAPTASSRRGPRPDDDGDNDDIEFIRPQPTPSDLKDAAARYPTSTYTDHHYFGKGLEGTLPLNDPAAVRLMMSMAEYDIRAQGWTPDEAALKKLDDAVAAVAAWIATGEPRTLLGAVEGDAPAIIEQADAWRTSAFGESIPTGAAVSPPRALRNPTDVDLSIERAPLAGLPALFMNAYKLQPGDLGRDDQTVLFATARLSLRGEQKGSIRVSIDLAHDRSRGLWLLAAVALDGRDAAPRLIGPRISPRLIIAPGYGLVDRPGAKSTGTSP